MKFTVRKREVRCTDAVLPYPIGDNADYVAEFTFDDEWKGKIKTARFMMGGQFAERILKDDKCIIPVEVLKHGFLRVGVYTDVITTTACEVYIRASIKESGVAAIPAPDVYAQIIKMLEDISENGVTDEQIARAIEEYLAENPIDGVNEDEVKRIVAEYVADNAEQFKGVDGKDGIDGKNGVDGKDGQNGKDGFSPIAKVEQTSEGALITITDAEGTTTAIVKNGKDGADGQGGAGGNSSIVYLTEAEYLQKVADGTVDMNTIYVTDKNLLDGNEVNY